MTFERESGLSTLEIANYPELFCKILVKNFGAKAANKMKVVLVDEIGLEFGIRFANGTTLNDAIQIVLGSWPARFDHDKRPKG
jgi:hypothetical protein